MVPLRKAFQRLGRPRVEAWLLAALWDGSACTTREILVATGLRQPEVSTGMRELVARAWVAAERLPPEGKGRPMHAYRLAVPQDVIVRHLADDAQRSQAELERALQVLRGTVHLGPRRTTPSKRAT